MGNFFQSFGFFSDAKKKSMLDFGVMDNKNVILGFRYWVNYFIDMTLGLFEYDGLSNTLPSIEIEKRLLTRGFSIIFDHPVEGRVTCDGNLYDYDFYRRYRKFNVYNPYRTFLQRFIPTGKTIGEDGIVIYNTGIEQWIDMQQGDNLFYTTIMRYARMMADIESTLSTELILQRMPFMTTAPDQQTADSIKRFFNGLECGEFNSINDPNFLQDIKTLKNKELVVNYISELINNRRNILSMFYSEIGIYQPDTKRERLLVDEVENGQNNEKTLIYSMLRAREQGIKEYNRFFKANARVNLRQVIYNTNVDITDMEEAGSNDII